MGMKDRFDIEQEIRGLEKERKVYLDYYDKNPLFHYACYVSRLDNVIDALKWVLEENKE
jgi:hypothetical protein